jgi:hypothetical protein
MLAFFSAPFKPSTSTSWVDVGTTRHQECLHGYRRGRLSSLAWPSTSTPTTSAAMATLRPSWLSRCRAHPHHLHLADLLQAEAEAVRSTGAPLFLIPSLVKPPSHHHPESSHPTESRRLTDCVAHRPAVGHALLAAPECRQHCRDSFLRITLIRTARRAGLVPTGRMRQHAAQCRRVACQRPVQGVMPVGLVVWPWAKMGPVLGKGLVLFIFLFFILFK